MRINTNVGALNSSKNAFINTMMTESSMRKLSSGLRISRAADDAAGLSIANKLRAQSRSLTVAAANSEQGNAMLQIAEGSASTIQRILERQKELIIQRESTGNNNSVTTTLNTDMRTSTPPTAAALAGPDPEIPPRNMATPMATSGNMPGPRPTSATANCTRRCATPERSKIEPTSTNMGNASKGYLASPA